MAKEGDFPKEELYDRINETTSLADEEKFSAYLAELEIRIGAKVTKGIKVTLKDISAF